MCVVCGCGETGAGKGGDAAVRAREGSHEHRHEHASGAGAAPGLEHGDLHYGQGPARVSVPGVSQARAIRIEQSVLGENDRLAARNRAFFHAHGVLALNLVSSPGSGKTTLLVETLRRLRHRSPELATAVIEGDQQTSVDADRIRATGVPAIQVNTGRGCHLDAQMVGEAFERLPQHGRGGVLFIENVGNLVCPALWDLGEAAKVVVHSVTEGDDKALKYPDMFAAASLVILNKIDLLPYVSFDVERALGFARRANPRIEIVQVSATTGAGLDAWLGWIDHELAHACGTLHSHDAAGAAGSEIETLRARVSELEAQLAARG